MDFNEDKELILKPQENKVAQMVGMNLINQVKSKELEKKTGGSSSKKDISPSPMKEDPNASELKLNV